MMSVVEIGVLLLYGLAMVVGLLGIVIPGIPGLLLVGAVTGAPTRPRSSDSTLVHRPAPAGPSRVTAFIAIHSPSGSRSRWIPRSTLMNIHCFPVEHVADAAGRVGHDQHALERGRLLAATSGTRSRVQHVAGPGSSNSPSTKRQSSAAW